MDGNDPHYDGNHDGESVSRTENMPGRPRQPPSVSGPIIGMALLALVATLVGVIAINFNCASSPSDYNGWGCRAGELYVPHIVGTVALIWVVAGLLAWAIVSVRRSVASE